jgi:uncharacterized repeat protein (TIGR03803 family)
MRISPLLILVAAAIANSLAVLAQPLQPEVLYNFPLGPRYPDCRLLEGTNGWFYGTTTQGGTYNFGMVFKVSTNGLWTTLFSFDGTNGASPSGPLVFGNDGGIYGTTRGGGSFGRGIVFRLGPTGTVRTVASFNGSDCCVDANELIRGGDGTLFGTTREGGSNNLGSVFQVSTNGLIKTLASFNGINGAAPNGLVLGTDGDLYGTTADGGPGFINPQISGWGTVFKLNQMGELTTLASFVGTNGLSPSGLIVGQDGNLYGTTYDGGEDWLSGGNLGNLGTVFRVTPGGILTTLVSFDNTNGANPNGLFVGANGNLYGTTGAGTIFELSEAGDLTTLASFASQQWPNAMVLGRDGDFYGTTGGCCAYPLGTVFRLSTNGDWTTLVTFREESASDINSLIAGSDGNFYGTTWHGGTNSSGSIFEISTNGAFSTLFSFSAKDAPWPNQLILGTDGSFYATTAQWGSGTLFRASSNWELTTIYAFTNSLPIRLAQSHSGDFYGVMEWRTSGYPPPQEYSLFKVTVDGMLRTLASWSSSSTDFNPFPFPDSLTFGADGALYAAGTGGILVLTTNGEVQTLALFNGANGSGPNALVVGPDGNFYGTTPDGGSTYLDQTNTGLGTVFKLTTNGVRTTLVSFDGSNGASPGGLVPGNDGSFYGFATAPLSNDAQLFRVTTTGALATLALFNVSTGSGPPANLVLGNDGNLYGTTGSGGGGGGGTFFRLVIPRLKSASREAGGHIQLRGTGPAKTPFRLWASPDVWRPLASWTLLTAASFDGTGNFSFTDRASQNGGSRFYQLSLP